MRRLRVFVVLGIFFSSVSFTTNSSVDWSKAKLNYNHFKGKAPKGVKSTNFNNLVKLVFINNIGFAKSNGHITRVILTNEIVESESWMAKESEELLSFAQLQFDISEYHTRLARQKIADMINGKKASENDIITAVSAEMKKRDAAVKDYALLCGDQVNLIKLYKEKYSNFLKKTSAWAN